MISLIWPLLQRYVPQRYYLGRITTLTMEAMSATCDMNVKSLVTDSGTQLWQRSVLSLRMDLQDASISCNGIRRIWVVLQTWPHSNKPLSQYRYLKFDTYILRVWRSWEYHHECRNCWKCRDLLSWSPFGIVARRVHLRNRLIPGTFFFQYIPCYRYVLCLLEVIRFSMRFAESSA